MEELKPKEKEFARKLIKNNENQTQTVKEVYGIEDDNYAHVKASRLLQKDTVKQEIAKVKKTIAERLPDDLLVEKNIALLNKMEMIDTKNEEGQTIRVESDQIDARAVAKGLEIAHRVKGTYSPDSAVNVNVNITPVLVRFINKKEDGDTDTV